jgi:glycerol-3-phosphate dehydrogenase
VTISDGRLITVTGGKLTTYREMAEDTVDAAVAELGRDVPRSARRCHTRALRLRGAEDYEDAHERSPHLADRYGGETAVLEAMIEADPSLAEPLVHGLPYQRVEALFAARYEMATTLDDILARRTRALLLGRDDAARAADEVAMLVGPELGWSPNEQAAQVDRFREIAEHQRTAPGLPPTDLAAHA